MKKIVSSLIACLLIFLSIQPIHAYTNINIELYSQYAYLYDRDTSLVYMEKKSNEKIYPASMTKILTVSLALDYITDLQEVVTIKQADFKGVVEEGATVAGLFPGEKVTYEDLLYGALLPSGADACQALARLIFGDVDHMVTAMNEKVIELGLQQTHFMNVTGLHDEKHYTTAHEMALILNHALQNKEFVKVFEARSYKSSKGNHQWISSLQNAKDNKDMDVSLINGGKSGFTDEAGLTYASTMTIDQHRLILVTAKAEDRRKRNHIRDAATVSQYMDQSFHNVVLYKKDEEIDTFWVLKSFQGSYQMKAQQDISLLVEKTINKSDLDIQVNIQKWKEAPIYKGDGLEIISVNYQGEPIYKYIETMPETIQSSTAAIVLHYGIIIGFPGLCIFIIGLKIYQRKKKKV